MWPPRDRVSIWLNDTLVLNGGRLRDFWSPGKAVIPSGALTILASREKTEYKNIYIRNLDPEK